MPLEIIISAFSTLPFLKIQTFIVGFPSQPFFNAFFGYFGVTHFKQVIFNLPFPITLPFSKSFLSVLLENLFFLKL